MCKKIANIIITLLLTILFISNVSAQELPFSSEDMLLTSSDYEEIKDLKERIDSEVPLGTIEYNKALKVYVDTDIISLQTDNTDIILNELNKANYVWIIPFLNDGECPIPNVEDGDHGYITLGRGEKLREEVKDYLTTEEQQEIINNEGKWGVNSVAYGGPIAYYDQILESVKDISDCKRVVLIGSQPGMQMPMALAMDESKAINWISLGFRYPVISDISVQRSSLQEEIYSFWDVTEKAIDYTKNAEGIVGGIGNANYSYFIGIVAIILVCIGASIIIYVNKGKDRSSE